MKQLTKDLAENQKKLDELLGVGRNYDVISRDLYIGAWKGRLYVIDGYGDDGVIERITSFLLGEGAALGRGASDMQEFINRCVTFCEVDCENQVDKILTGAFLGKTILLLEGFDYCAMIDAKKFPGRSVEEPSDGKVLRGSHDGFTETLVQNTALLRRRIRDPHFTLENHKVGGRSQTDVVLAYMDNQVNQGDLESLRAKLDAIDVGSVAMSQESVAEAIVKPQWYNPFPKVRYTERPDTAAACVMAMVCASEYPPMSQAKIAPGNMAGSAPIIWKRGAMTGPRKEPIIGASKIIPTMGIHMEPNVSKPALICPPNPNRLPKHLSKAANSIKHTITFTII